MKKVYASFLFVGLTSMCFAQVPTKAKQVSFVKDASAIKTTPVTATPKAFGDVIWENDFSYTASWDISSTGGTTSPGFGWSISSSDLPWSPALSAGMNSTSGGNYALCQNGDPVDGTQQTGATWTMEYDTTFDISSYSNVIFQFEQYGARFTDRQSVEVSTDNGATWVSIGNNNDIPNLTAGGGSAYPNPMVRQYGITSTLGTNPAAMRIRFKVSYEDATAANDGIMYGWFVDDVKLIEGGTNDLAITRGFNFTGTQLLTYTKFPVGQTGTDATMVFTADVSNHGSAAQDAVVTATNSAGLNSASTATSIPAFSSDSLEISTAYQIPGTVGNADVTFTVTSDNATLENTGDDTYLMPFTVTDNLFASDAATTQSSSFSGSFIGWANPTGDAQIGTLFEIFNDVELPTVQIGIGNVGTSGQADYLGNLYKIMVSYYDENSGDFQYLGQSLEYELKATDFGKIKNIPLEAPVQLFAGGLFMVTVYTYVDAPIPVAFSGTVPLGQTVGYDGATRYSLAADEGLDVVDAPVVRMNFQDYAGVEEFASNSSIEVYPNPFVNDFAVNVETASDVEAHIYVTDMSGRIVTDLGTRSLKAGKTTVSVETNGLQAGAYNCIIEANGQQVVKRIIKK